MVSKTYNIGDSSLFIKYLSIYLKETYLSTLEVSDIYNLDFAICVYKYLRDNFPKKDNYDSVADNYLNKCLIYKAIEIEESYQGVQDHFKNYDMSTEITPESIFDINKYNLSSWPINETELQFLSNLTVVSETSPYEDIANMQNLMRAMNYEPEEVGVIDDNFTANCASIQTKLKLSNPNIVVSGYCDIFVEKYLRSLNDIKITQHQS